MVVPGSGVLKFLALVPYAVIWGFLGSFSLPPLVLVVLPPLAFLSRSMLEAGWCSADCGPWEPRQMVWPRVVTWIAWQEWQGLGQLACERLNVLQDHCKWRARDLPKCRASCQHVAVACSLQH